MVRPWLLFLCYNVASRGTIDPSLLVTDFVNPFADWNMPYIQLDKLTLPFYCNTSEHPIFQMNNFKTHADLIRCYMLWHNKQFDILFDDDTPIVNAPVVLLSVSRGLADTLGIVCRCLKAAIETGALLWFQDERKWSQVAVASSFKWVTNSKALKWITNPPENKALNFAGCSNKSPKFDHWVKEHTRAKLREFNPWAPPMINLAYQPSQLVMAGMHEAVGNRSGFIMVGIHIRTDFFDPALTSNKALKHYMHFITCFERVAKYLTKNFHLPVRPLVTADHRVTVRQMANKLRKYNPIQYPTQASDLVEDSVEVHERAFGDFFLFASSDFIIGTKSSSFTDFGRLYGNFEPENMALLGHPLVQNSTEEDDDPILLPEPGTCDFE